ncbi:hypothetical protein FNF29_06147 [Cafeteria roenbergensis]|uniref:Acyl-coenzyme A oxidase n=1 Tax=Cafeteria roenbergensis TaxID=33653 RepID=A0A5A8CB64_CAFRO|nr:hypothetical protein FNF29_06147 [Cafeteria roenbergensis]|eukprot:KAA0149260.1 hypothetical protein FNF29_06147 [Cafeteria roenbergensis]
MASSASHASARAGAVARHLATVDVGAVKGILLTDDGLAARTMSNERAKASFDVREMMECLDGDPALTEAKREVMAVLEAAHLPSATASEAVLRCDDVPDWTREDARRRVMQKVRRTYRLFLEAGSDLTKRNAILEVLGLADPSWATRNGVHFGLFLGAITSQGDDEQQAEWAPLALTLSIFGCFAMTEMGHGSFTRGVETTATFLPGAGEDGDGEFEINTPTVAASKWWIGGAAHTATHAAVYARLLLPAGPNAATGGGAGGGGGAAGGAGLLDYGVHVFVVQLREPETGDLMPGVRAGDCGEKVGRHGIDNGWLQFAGARVPRRQMLMRVAAVSPEGHYSRPGSGRGGADAAASGKGDKLAYGALVMGRATMVKDSADWLKLGLTIALRYAAVRRQGQPRGRVGGPAVPAPAKGRGVPVATAEQRAALAARSPDDPYLEPQLLEYSTVRRRLLPLCAAAVALQVTGQRMMRMHEQLQQAIEDTGDVSDLPAVHAASAGLKAFCTWLTHDALEVCRQQLGGHGYSAYNALGAMISDFAVQCTWEGDNTVLALQTARALMAAVDGSAGGDAAAARAATKRAGAVYLGSPPAGCDAATQEAVSSAGALQAMLDAAAVQACEEAAARLRAERARLAGSAAGRTAMGPGVPEAVQSRAWDAASPLLVEASRAHVWRTVFEWACRAADEREAAEGRGEGGGAASGVACTLRRLVALFGVWRARAAMAPLLRRGHLSAQQAAWLEAEEERLCDALRPDAVAMTDAFGYSDAVVKAPFGRADGDIYSAYMRRVAAAPGATDKPAYRDAEIVPLIEGRDLET